MSSVTQDPPALLAREWLCLQNQYDSYEKWSLVIKLVNLVLCTLLLASKAESYLVMLPVVILWLQDAIWKTFQGRIGDRILALEKAIIAGDDKQAMQFNSQWLNARPGAIALIGEYLSQALKPTVAYPHGVLLILTLYAAIML